MIHPTAIVETTGTIGDGVQIGPYAVVQGHVTLGEGCRVAAHAQLLNRITLGKACVVGPGAVIGADPQDSSFDPETDSGLEAGERNVFREHVTIHRSSRPGGATRLGNGNFLMAGAHVGHDTVIGDDNIIANNCMLGGHVTMGSGAFLGGGAGFHQFVRIGDLCMVQGHASVSKDLPPYLVSSLYNGVASLNRIGLQRAGVTPATIKEIREAYHLFYHAGLNLSQSLAAAETKTWNSPEANRFLDFFRAESKKGVCLRLSRRGT